MCIQKNKYKICGIDAFKFIGPAVVATIQDAILMLFRNIRADPFLRNVPILLVPESNYANEAAYIEAEIRRIPEITNVRLISDDETKKLGVWTSELSKLKGYDVMKTYIATSGLKFYRKLIVINNEYEIAFKGSDPRKAMRSLLISQIKQLKQYGKKKAKGNNLIVITGIHGEDGKRLPLVDDVVMALVIFMFNSTRFFKRDFPNLNYNEIYQMRHKVIHRDEEFSNINKSLGRKLTQQQKYHRDIQQSGLFF
jgi:hypothetical protein